MSSPPPTTTYSPLLTLFALLLASTALSFPTLQGPAPYEFIANEATPSSSGRIGRRDVGGVTVCTGANFTGQCWSGTYPVETCVALNDFAGHVLSFKPDNGTECYLMQGRCNSEEDYADLYSYSTDDNDLSGYPWIGNATSYICFST